jgi:hypothetical protein
MQAAPQVLYPLGRSRFLHALLALIGLLVLAVMAGVALSQPRLHLVGVMALLLVLALTLTLRSGPVPGGRLLWDGTHWHLQGDHPKRGQLTLVIDLQRALLLRWVSPSFASDPTSRWLWIEEHADPVIWKDVRRAIYWHTH